MNVSGPLYVVVLVLLSAATVLSNPAHHERVCRGMRSGGLGFSGTFQQWYDSAMAHYRNCNYVNGDLLLTWHQDSDVLYDFNFLRSIRYVSGFVLIAMSNTRVELPLVNLEVIRGNSTFLHNGGAYGLAILMTNFTTLRLPKLIEISNGAVLTFNNDPGQRIELSRSFDDIMKGQAESSVDLQYPDSVIINTYGGQYVDWSGICSDWCPHRCYVAGEDGCCAGQCAGRCTGPGTDQCERCKDFYHGGECVSYCPPPYRPHGSRCTLRRHGTRPRMVQRRRLGQGRRFTP